MKTYYFDHCASTPLYPTVIDTIAEVMRLHYANPSSLHRSGAEAQKLVDRARASIAERLDASPREVVFTSGGTESNNLAILGTMAAATRPSKHAITTAVEHASVYQSMHRLEQSGIEVTTLPVDGHGRVDPRKVENAIRKDTVLVSVMHVNNETGAIQPIEEIGAIIARHPHVRFHVDGIQALGKVPFDWKSSGAHLYTGSAHKFRGPKGVGFLLAKEGTALAPILHGGGQENGVRSGTSNVPGILGASQALRLYMEGMEERRTRMYGLRRRLLEAAESIPELVVNGFGADADESMTAPHVVNLSYPGMRPEVIVHMLEKHGALVSTQSACSTKSLQPSRVLLAMGYDEERSSGSIRISFGDEHTEEDIDTLAERLRMAVDKLKPLERNRK